MRATANPPAPVSRRALGVMHAPARELCPLSSRVELRSIGGPLRPRIRVAANSIESADEGFGPQEAEP